ncbi:hypothetical protein DPMN_032180 [Dreissena polymorpha]|uniref:Uncharacterized protein n=1 Tax=Dreissena polymorpha TaxID=45954 RepID=A0A9D4RI02_DREPO|nr:hypothetical protein DPMN_032180 [Dreissena polymorpha]
MATTVSRSLPDGIGQGHRPMPDQLAPAIRSLSGDNAGHVMTGTSPGTGPVTGDPVRAMTGHRPSGTGPVTGPTNRSPVIAQCRIRELYRLLSREKTVSLLCLYGTDRCPVGRTGHQLQMTGDRWVGPVTGDRTSLR